MDGLRDSQWLIWLAAALAAGLIEVVSLDFFFLMIAGGALIAGVAASFDASVPLQVIIFAISSGILLLTGRPALKRWAQRTPIIQTNAGALVGQDARVLQTVTDLTGQVKLAGEVWTARTAAGDASLEVGSDVYVVRIDGATALVTPKPAPPAPPTLLGRPTA
jgi:membrane protein implicated in regulation of membrane protease activity